ncbi:hypothetical protein EYR40_000622 [Pleurotus pulmonarius]|nr:hypothetical protein EYR40_000622 [Pleurotus pulmonarius]
MSSAEAANEGATVQISVLLDETKEGKPEFETNVVAAESDDFPDGGLRAWLVLSGAMCITFSTFGYVNAWGVFQAYYQETLLKDSSTSSIAWIGSIQYALVFLPGLVVGRLFDLGYLRSMLWIASASLVAATFLIAQCTKYWHFLLCQGIVIGLASGICFSPSTAVLAHWFKRKRGVALGLLAVGSSVGGTLFPIIARLLITRVGFQWTMRIIGFILVVSLSFANLTIQRRLPPTNVSGGLFNLNAFKYAPFTIYCLSGFTIYLGLYTVLTYIDVAATAAGISADFSFYLVAIANASSGFGRLASGYVADSHVYQIILMVIPEGPINAMIPTTAIAGILTYAWPFAQDKSSLIAIAVLYGFFSGTYTSLLAKPMMELGDTGDVGRRLGMFMSILAIGALIGPPISGAINTATGGFHVVGYYAASLCHSMASAPLPATASQMFDDDAEKRDAIEKLQIETTSVPAPADDFPDGGLRAWSVVLGASLSAFSTFGYVNAWGVFQSYYEQEILPTTSPSTIAWIGSIQYSLIFLPGLFFGRLFDLGYFKIPLLISSTILVLATFLVAQCTEYWQFLLCQGFAIGLASGAIFGPNIGIVGHWFLKRRGLAFGFTAAGSSIGGTIFPIAARKLIPQVGFPWTMRIIGFILILTMGIPNVVLQRRIPPKKVSGAGPPISGAINRATGGYTAVGYYAGSMILVAVVLMLISRHLVLKRVWGKF